MHQTILTRDEGEQFSSFEGKRVVPLDSESSNYREWAVTVGGTQYCIVAESFRTQGDDPTAAHPTFWALLYYVPDIDFWCDVPDMDVDMFLSTHKLILAA
jgi:hypothetical protein